MEQLKKKKLNAHTNHSDDSILTVPLKCRFVLLMRPCAGAPELYLCSVPFTG